MRLSVFLGGLCHRPIDDWVDSLVSQNQVCSRLWKTGAPELLRGGGQNHVSMNLSGFPLRGPHLRPPLLLRCGNPSFTSGAYATALDWNRLTFILTLASTQ